MSERASWWLAQVLCAVTIIGGIAYVVLMFVALLTNAVVSK